MRVPVGNSGWYLCKRSDEPEEDEYREFHGTGVLAQQWTQQFRGDVSAWRWVRTLMGGVFRLTDEQVAREVARRLTTGEWVARKPVPPWEGVSSNPEELPPAFTREERRPPAAPQTPPPDAPVFPNDIDPAAIAAAQKRAAELGVPFCEECLRAQLAHA